MKFTGLTAAKSEAATAWWLKVSLRAGREMLLTVLFYLFGHVLDTSWHYKLQRSTQPASKHGCLIEYDCMSCPVVSSWGGSEDALHQHDAKIWGASQTPFRGKWSKCHVPRRPGQGRRTGKKLHATSWDASKSKKVHRPLVDPAYQSWIWYLWCCPLLKNRWKLGGRLFWHLLQWSRLGTEAKLADQQLYQRTSKCGGFWFCHFMPLQVAYATSSRVCHFEWRMPLRVAYATSSGVCHFEWRMPLRVACATSSGVCHFEWRVPLRVAYATSSGVSHFEWRVPLRVACATSSGVLTV